MMISLKFYGNKNFEELKDIWAELEKGEDMTIFQSYIWYKGLNSQYNTGCFRKWESAVYAVAYKDGKPCMIAPIHIKKLGASYKGIGSSAGAYIIGKWGFADYLNFIYREFDADCVEEIVKAIKKKYRVKKFYFDFIMQKTQMCKYLKEKYSESFVSTTICVQTLPHESFDEFHKTMTKYSRQNIRKAFNRENKTEMEIHITEFGKVTQQEADEFFSIYLDRSSVKNELNIKKDGLKTTALKYFNKKYNERLKAGLGKFNYITYNMVNNEDSYMIGIFNADKKIGFIYGIMENVNIWRNIIVCFDEEYKYYTPGRTAYFRYFRDILYKDGATDMITDMSRGTERHKYELGGTEHYLENYVI